MSGITIRTADYHNPVDAAAAVGLLDAYARDPMGGGEPLSGFSRSNLATALAARPDALTLLAFDEDTAIGLLNAFEGFSTFHCRPLFNIHDLYVAPAYRNRGLSRRLIASLEEIARDRGCCKLTLEVLSGNQPARSSYRRAGFAPYQLDAAQGQAEFWQKILK
jgi:GNAT superfamily N-acetyltransferase